MSAAALLDTRSDQAIVTAATLETAEWLGLSRSELAECLGVSDATIGRMKRGEVINNAKSFELALLLIRVYRALFAILGGDRTAIQHWINTPNQHLQLQSPKQLLQQVTGIASLVHYLDAMRGKI